MRNLFLLLLGFFFPSLLLRLCSFQIFSCTSVQSQTNMVSRTLELRLRTFLPLRALSEYQRFCVNGETQRFYDMV